LIPLQSELPRAGIADGIPGIFDQLAEEAYAFSSDPIFIGASLSRE